MEWLESELTMRHAIQAPAFFLGGILIGWVLYRLMRGRLKRLATLTSWGGDDIVVGAVHDVLLVWFALGGLYGAARSLPLTAEAHDLTGKVLLTATILSATWVGSRVAADSLKLWSLRAGEGGRGSSIFVALARITVWAIGLMVTLQTLGISITPILTALGVGGLAVALAMQDTLSNLFAGIQIIASKKIRVGEYIKLDTGDEGYVTDINWRYLTMRQLPNNIVVVPNARFAEAIVTNYYGPAREMSILIQVGVAYSSDLDHVERVTIDVARETMRAVEGGVADFEPLVRFHTFNDSSIDMTVVLRAAEFADQFLIKHEFVKRLHARFGREGIEIPFPIRTVKLER